MNLLILFGVIATSALAVSGYEYQSEKLDRWYADIPGGSPPAPTEGLGPSNQFYEGIFRTRLDHFRPQNQQRVDFVYHVNANFFQEGGPLYIYLKDYRDYTTRWIESGLMVDIARETGAALMTLDHRYFGRNRPQDTASFDDLELLTAEQSLHDIAEFVRFVRQYIGNNQYSRVILWGSGYGATLAVYARSRFPHLIYAAWSSSGYLEAQLASYGVYDVLEYTFFIDDQGQCRDLIQNAYNVVAYLIANSDGEYLAERLNLCDTVDTSSDADIASLYELTMRAVMFYIDQYHYLGVRAFCNDMNAIPGDSLNSFARWVRYVYGDSECFDHSYVNMIERTSNSTWNTEATDMGTRQWYFLQCTQIGGFLLADGYTWLSGRVSLDYHIQKCADIFGNEIDFNNLYEAFYALRSEFNQAVTNVVYTNGYFDAFRYFGRMYDTSGVGTVINMEFAAKSADLPSQSVNDPESIYNAKSDIRALILRWSNATERAFPSIVEQALADISTFIRFIRTIVGLNTYSRVVLWGSDMGGTLAVYARKRYPHLIAGAWSSSGIFQLDVYGYGPFDYLEDTISQYTNFECTGRLQSAFTEMQQLIANDQGDVLQEKLNLCQSVVTDSSLDTAALWEGTVRMIMRYIEEYHLNGVNAFCRDMNAVSDAFDAFARWLRYVYGDTVCFDHSYENIVARNRDPEWDRNGTLVGTRQLLYMQCIQIGLFPVADSFTWLNGTLPLEYHFQKCADVLRPQFNSSNLFYAISELYYEFEIIEMPNIVYTGGSIDPWRYFGRWISYLNPVYMIHYHSKSSDLPSIHYSDPEDLYNVKHAIRDLVLLWSKI